MLPGNGTPAELAIQLLARGAREQPGLKKKNQAKKRNKKIARLISKKNPTCGGAIVNVLLNKTLKMARPQTTKFLFNSGAVLLCPIGDTFK